MWAFEQKIYTVLLLMGMWQVSLYSSQLKVGICKVFLYPLLGRQAPAFADGIWSSIYNRLEFWFPFCCCYRLARNTYRILLNQILDFSLLCASFALNNNVKEMRNKFRLNITGLGSFIKKPTELSVLNCGRWFVCCHIIRLLTFSFLFTEPSITSICRCNSSQSRWAHLKLHLLFKQTKARV